LHVNVLITSEPRQSALHALPVASALGAYMIPVKLPACAPFPSSTEPAPARYTRSFVGSPFRFTSSPAKLTLRFVPFVDITKSSTTPLFADPEPTANVLGNEIVPPAASASVHLYAPGSRLAGKVPPTAGHGSTTEGTHGVGGTLGAAGHEGAGSWGL